MKAKRIALVVMLGCHHDPAPVTAADPPPLPPASGTPIGYLIDDAGDLHLSSDQLGKLREIDSTLANELEVIDTRLRAENRPVEAAAAPPAQMGGRGGRRSGMGRMGGGGMGGSGRGGTGGAGRSGARHPQPATGDDHAAHRASADKLTEQRTADVRDALHRAFDVLDTDQQAAAHQVLVAHDVDLDSQVAPAADGSPDER